MKKKKGIVILVAVLGCLCLLAAWGKTVELLDRSKLIDLSLAIERAPIGHQGNTTDLEGEQSEEGTHELNNQEQPENPSDEQPVIQDTPAKNLVVSIRDEEIRFCGAVVRDEDMLRQSLMTQYTEGDILTLVDDYAEAHVYRMVKTMLTDCVGSSCIRYDMSE